jgi:hypothetical protein
MSIEIVVLLIILLMSYVFGCALAQPPEQSSFENSEHEAQHTYNLND